MTTLTSLMGIKLMEFEDKLETKLRHNKQKLENVLNSGNKTKMLGRKI